VKLSVTAMMRGEGGARVGDGTADPVAVQNVERSRKPGFRADVEGLRALAILMVAVYHVWIGRVSGGVDIFLMISGFFVGASLVRSFAQGRPVSLWSYWCRIFGRLLPPAAVVLATVLVATFVLLPKTSMTVAATQALASMFYVENWYLATSGRAYGAADAAQSPFQHFWSLSVQGQLYLVLPLVLLGLAVALRSRASRRVYLGVVVALLVASFAYATFRTTVNQPVTYYDTFARAWQYLLGTVLAFVVARTSVAHLSLRTRSVLGVAGAVAVLSTGVLLDGLAQFPGPVALVPLLGAAAILVAGTGAGVTPVTRLLAWRPLVVAGGYAYPFYLWHWPVLLLTIAVFGLDDVSWSTGAAVLLVSSVLAWATQELLRRRTAVARRAVDRGPKVSFSRISVVGGLAVTTVFVGSLSWIGYVALQHRLVDTAGSLDPQTFPGARSLIDPVAWPVPDGVSPEPSPLVAQLDWPTAGQDECYTGFEDSSINLCTFGAADGDLRVALVGGSHSMSLLLPTVRVAEERSVQLDTYFKQACPLRLEDEDDESSCETWSAEVVDRLVYDEDGYDAVILVGTRPTADGSDDYVPDAYVRAWLPLLEAEIPVIAVRDNPWLPFDAPACVEAAERLDDCSVNQSSVLSSSNPLEELVDYYALLHTIDMTDLFCADWTCPAVIGNVLAYIDDNHLTAAYSRTLAPELDVRLGKVTGWW